VFSSERLTYFLILGCLFSTITPSDAFPAADNENAGDKQYPKGYRIFPRPPKHSVLVKYSDDIKTDISATL
jgi:hypothetical protein